MNSTFGHPRLLHAATMGLVDPDFLRMVVHDDEAVAPTIVSGRLRLRDLWRLEHASIASYWRRRLSITRAGPQR